MSHELRQGGDGCQLLAWYEVSGSGKRQVEYVFGIDDPTDLDAPGQVTIDSLKSKDLTSVGVAALGYGNAVDPPVVISRTVTVTLNAELSFLTGKKHDPTNVVLDADNQTWSVNVPATPSDCTFGSAD